MWLFLDSSLYLCVAVLLCQFHLCLVTLLVDICSVNSTDTVGGTGHLSGFCSSV